MVTARLVEKKLTELGRLRIGNREANKSGTGTHPHKLSHFRLTSPNGSLLTFAAQRYGGTVEPWDDAWAPKDEHERPTQFELYTTTTEIEVLIPTMSAISLSYERWSASGCQQRCSGTTILDCPLNEALVGEPCNCPADDTQRASLAEKGKACARILRLNVLLPELPGMGVWRLETKGYYATAELMGTLDMLQMAGQEHQIIEAVLRLEQRTVKRVGQGEGKGKLDFAVPVLWPKYTPRQILSGASQALLTPAPVTPPPPLVQLNAELYGERRDASSRTAMDFAPQIEAAILAQPGGEVEPWYVWAENRLRTTRGRFTPENWQWFLDTVRSRAAEHPARATGSTPPAPEVPMATAEEMDLWQQEEREAHAEGDE